MANDWKTNYNPLQAALLINLNKIQPEHNWPLWFLAELMKWILVPIQIWPNKEPVYVNHSPSIIKHIQISDLSYNKGALRKELRNFI